MSILRPLARWRHLLVLLPMATAHAETLTLPRALELAEQHSPRLQIALTEVERARSGIRSARALPNPELDLRAGQSRGRSAGNPNGSSGSIGISQPIDLPSQRAPRIRAAESGLEATRHGVDEERLLLRAEIRQAFYTALRRKAEYELALDNKNLLEQTRNRIELSVKVGERARFELVRIEAELANAVNQMGSAKLRIAQALAALRTLVGAPLPTDFDIIGALAPDEPLPPLASLQERLLARHPSLRRAGADLARAEQRLEAERALRTPRPTLFAGMDRDPSQGIATVGIAIPIPLWDQRQGPIGEAVAQFQQAAAFRDRLRIELLGELDLNYSRLLVARQQIAAYEGGLIRQAESSLKVAEAAFRFGERGFLEVLDAQRVLRTIRADFLNARFEKQAALVELERLTANDLARTQP